MEYMFMVPAHPPCICIAWRPGPHVSSVVAILMRIGRFHPVGLPASLSWTAAAPPRW